MLAVLYGRLNVSQEAIKMKGKKMTSTTEKIHADIAREQAAVVAYKKLSLDALAEGNMALFNECEKIADVAMKNIEFHLLVLRAITN